MIMRKFLGKVCFLFLLGTLAAADEAGMKISGFTSNHDVLVDAGQDHDVPIGAHLLVRSRSGNEVLGSVEVVAKKVQPEDRHVILQAKISYHEKNSFPLLGDVIEEVDFSKESPLYPGRGDLEISHQPNISARYKPLYLMSQVAGETASTLDKNEKFFEIFTYSSYGVTDSLTLTSILLADVAGIYNVLAKYRFVATDDFSFSVQTGYVHGQGASTLASDILGFVFYLDTQTNSKLISHTHFSYGYRFQAPNANYNFPTESINSTTFQTGYEYIFDNWDRLVIGPSYNFNLKAFGGHLGYVFIWDHFNLAIYAQTQNFLDFRIAGNAYVPSLDLFWRF
jgi:hypothetical protein